MNKKIFIFMLLIILVLSCFLVFIVFEQKKTSIETATNEVLLKQHVQNNKIKEKILNNMIDVLPTLQDAVISNSVWCGTFQLAWNDMQDNLTNGGIFFDISSQFAENLNKQSFKENNISNDYYYKNYGIMNLSLKNQIKNDIKEKFDSNCELLDLFDWKEDKSVQNKYFFYSMLDKKIEFEKEFSVLESAPFENKSNINYFGINDFTDESVRKQVKVLYYTDENNFAITLLTKENDEIIFVRNPEGKTFEEIFNNANKQSKKYKGSSSFEKNDSLAIPNIKIDLIKDYSELENKYFRLKDGEEACIEKALQTIEFELDNTGGSVKSEAGLATTNKASTTKPRKFNVNGKFAFFIKENSKELPYYATNVEDITLFINKEK